MPRTCPGCEHYVEPVAHYFPDPEDPAVEPGWYLLCPVCPYSFGLSEHDYGQQ